MKLSKEHSYLAPRNVEAAHEKITAAAQKGLSLESLKKVGIGMDADDISAMATALDAAGPQGLFAAPNIGNPVQFLQSWMPGHVRLVTAVRAIDDLIGLSTIGNWEDEEIIFQFVEPTGTPSLYGDLNEVPFSNYNTQYDRRTVVRFEQGFRVGKLEEARAGRAMFSAATEKRAAQVLALELLRNSVGFYGYNGGANRTYGFLNDPNLPGYVTVAAGATSGTLSWNTKTALEIDADLRTAFAALRAQSGGLIDPKKVPVTVAVPLYAMDRLTTNSDFGYSVQKWLDDNYPKARIVGVPELLGANGGSNVFYVFADSIPNSGTDDGRVFSQMVPAKYQIVGSMRLIKGYEEDATNALAGVYCKRPMGVVRYSGI